MKKLKVVAFGDSLTAGSALHEGDPNWTDLLASMFDVDIINAGIGGNTTTEALSRIESDVYAQKPDIVLIAFGMNDHVIVDVDGRTNTEQSVFRNNLIAIIDGVRGIGAKPILITPNAVMEEYYFTRHPVQWYAPVGGANEQLAVYCDIIRSVADEYEVPLADIFKESCKYDLSKLLRTPDHGGFDDGVHPYGDGIQFFAEIIHPLLLSVMNMCG